MVSGRFQEGMKGGTFTDVEKRLQKLENILQTLMQLVVNKENYLKINNENVVNTSLLSASNKNRPMEGGYRKSSVDFGGIATGNGLSRGVSTNNNMPLSYGQTVAEFASVVARANQRNL